MLVFITNPKYFDIKSIENKKVDLIYIFNSIKLFEHLSSNYKCVNIGKNGKILNENYFPKQSLKEYFGVLNFKQGIYTYFKKKHYNYQRKMYLMRGGFKDVTYKIVLSEAKRYEKKDINLSFNIYEKAIIREVIGIIEFEYSKKWTENNNLQLNYIFNLTNSFYRAYIYTLFRKRGLEIFGDLWKYNLFLNIVLHYPFNQFDVYQDRFRFNYLKIMSRLFIEQIHKNDIKGFIKNNVDYYKEQGWL